MKRTDKIRAYLARTLAAVMVITMVAPPASVYVLSYGDPAVIRFDPKEGSDLSHSNYMNVLRDGSWITYATGRAGHPLAEAGDFNGIAVENLGSGDRPVLPALDMDLSWPGYTFDGWYNVDGNKILYLSFAFPYNSTTAYEACWNGDASSQFDFTIMYHRDLNEDRNGDMNGEDPNAWPEADDSQIYKFFDGRSWITRVTVNTAVSTTHKRDIPGCKVFPVIIKDNKTRRFDDAPGHGTLGEAATANESTRSVRGNMSNDDLTVVYGYESDNSKKFVLRVEYVDGSGRAVRIPGSYLYSAESQASAASIQVTVYILIGAQIKTGSGDIDDLSGRGIYSAQTAGRTFSTQKNSIGKMPNQPVAVVYTCEIDPSHVTHVIINRIGNHNNVLAEPETREVSPNETVMVNIERKTGCTYPSNTGWNGISADISMDQTASMLSFKTDFTGGTVTVIYNEDLNDTTH